MFRGMGETEGNTYSAGHLLDDSEKEFDVLVGANGSLGRHGE